MAVKTMGEAVDVAIKVHQKKYPESWVYDVKVAKVWGRPLFLIDLHAEHFSESLRYEVIEG